MSAQGCQQNQQEPDRKEIEVEQRDAKGEDLPVEERENGIVEEKTAQEKEG